MMDNFFIIRQKTLIYAFLDIFDKFFKKHNWLAK